jgi:hypothetical protein
MNVFSLSLALQTDAANSSTASATSAVSIPTALLILLALAVVLLAGALAKLRARVASLETQTVTATNETPDASLATPRLTSQAATHATDSEIPSAEILAAIAAAIHVTLAGQARIVGVTPAHNEDRVWSLEGRRQIFHSHKVR